jgi:hypothetical protein
VKSILVFLCLFAATAIAQDVPLEPFAATDSVDARSGNQKIGWFLEQQFAPYLRSCGFTNNKLFANKRQISSVPRAIWGTGLRTPWDWVQRPRGISIAREFARITTSQEWTLDNSFLDVNFEQNAVDMLPGGTSAVIYAHDCASILGAAASFDSNLNFPAASIAAAIKASMENETNARLGLVVGHFESPFFKALGDDRVSTYAYLLLWDYYRELAKNGGNPNATYWALKSADGIAIYWVTKKKQEFSGRMNLNLATSSFFGSKATFTSDASVHNQSDLELRNFEFAAFARDGEPKPIDKQAVPSAAQVIAELSKHRAWLDKNDTSWTPTIVGETTHVQILDQVPERLCNDQSGWEIEEKEKGTHTLKFDAQGISPKVDEEKNIPACAFRIRFVPSPKELQEGGIRLEYAFTLKAGPLLAKISAAEVVYKTTNKPQLTLLERVTSTWTPVTIGGENLLTWSIKVHLDQDVRKVRDELSAGSFEKLKLQCGTNRTIERLFASNPRVSQSNVEFTLQYAYSDQDDLGAFELCTLGGDIVLPLDGDSAKRTLPSGIELRFPRAKIVQPQTSQPLRQPETTNPTSPKP